MPTICTISRRGGKRRGWRFAEGGHSCAGEGVNLLPRIMRNGPPLIPPLALITALRSHWPLQPPLVLRFPLPQPTAIGAHCALIGYLTPPHSAPFPHPPTEKFHNM